MFDLAVIRTGIRYGVMAGVACFVVILVLFFTGQDPYGEKALFSLLLMPVFIFLGVRYFKKFNDAEIGFLKAFSVGFSVSMYGAMCSAMLLYVFATFAGPEVTQLHIHEMRAMMDANREAMISAANEQTFEEAYKLLDQLTPYQLAVQDFINKIFVGMILSLVAGVFFRK